jgi:hypothetical protein
LEAIYIMGQVYHSLGRAAEAIAEYTQVQDRFPDAAEAIHYFTRQAISLPDVTTLRPQDGKQVTLSFRNLTTAAISVYRIDLLKFGLLQRSLDRIAAINLAGVRPLHSETLVLGDGADYQDREQLLNLPLDQEGAYLVVARGNHLYASGLVLVSPLELDVREDAAAGRVRVTVQDAVAGSYSSKVLVKVIGSQNDGFTTGETDLRGLFVANNIRGLSTVIAQADGGRYAFHRGTLALGPTPSDAPPPDAVFELPAAAPGMGVELELLRHNSIDSNGAIQLDNRARFEKLLNNTYQGIPAEAAY